MPLSSLLRHAAAGEAERLKVQVRRAIQSLVVMLVVALLMVTALVFVMVGAYQSLALRLPPWQAGCLVALGTALASLLLLLLVSRRGRSARSVPPRRRPPAASLSEEDVEAVAELGASAGDFMRRRRPRGVELTAAAFLVGLVSSWVSSRRRPRPPD